MQAWTKRRGTKREGKRENVGKKSEEGNEGENLKKTEEQRALIIKLEATR